MKSTRKTSQRRGRSSSDGGSPSDPHPTSGGHRPNRWTGLGVSIGAGVGMTIGLIVGGGTGMALGIAFGAGVGVVVGSAFDNKP